jgi:hypothetical protein
MKKVFSALVIFIIVANAQAQTSLGIKGAYNFATAKAVYSSVKQSTSYTSGYGVGVVAKIPFDGVLFFSPSLMINNRGFIVKNPAGSTNKKEQFSLTYLDIIPSLSIDVESVNDVFSISAGPVLGFTNFGKTKTTNAAGTTSSKKIEFGYGSYGWADLGLQVGLGYRINNVGIDATYYIGLTNINNQEEIDGRDLQNRVASIGVIYYFKKKDD